MTQSMNKRSRVVTIIGYFCIVAGLWGALPDVWNISRWILEPASAVAVQETTSTDKWNCMLGVGSMFIDLACSVVDLVGGIYLLKLRAWARTAIETNAWIEILVFAVGQVLCGIYKGCFTNLLAGWSTMAIVQGWLFLGAKCALVGTVNGLVIYFLRSKTVREAVSGGTGRAEGTATV